MNNKSQHTKREAYEYSLAMTQLEWVHIGRNPIPNLHSQTELSQYGNCDVFVVRKMIRKILTCFSRGILGDVGDVL